MCNLCCRACGATLEHTVIDLGHQPPSNAYLTFDQLFKPEVYFPLTVYLCTSCWLVQLPEHASASELFTDNYAYFSSTSSSMCKHASDFVDSVVDKLNLNADSLVIELASNDGYLLQFLKALNIPCLGIEPTLATAHSALKKDIPTLTEFFGANLALSLEKADLVIANNVLPHVPDICDFIQGISRILKPKGFASIEFQHLLRMLEGNQFDTIYHEHYSYLSLSVVNRIASQFGLMVCDVEEISTHGGSLRVWLTHTGSVLPTRRVSDVLMVENSFGLENISTYNSFQKRAQDCKIRLIEFLLRAHDSKCRVLGYGAAAKGSTLLNYAGIKADLLPAVADLAPSKQGKFYPGSHIPIISPEELYGLNPDQLLIFPWNIISELKNSLVNYDLVTTIPYLKIHPASS